jgi:hypothetical protein
MATNGFIRQKSNCGFFVRRIVFLTLETTPSKQKIEPEAENGSALTENKMEQWKNNME